MKLPISNTTKFLFLFIVLVSFSIGTIDAEINNSNQLPIISGCEYPPPACDWPGGGGGGGACSMPTGYCYMGYSDHIDVGFSHFENQILV